MIARLKIQKLEELKMQVLASNPTLLGVGVPGPEETEVGSEIGGPNPMLGDDPQQGPPVQGMRKYMDSEDDGQMTDLQDPQMGGESPIAGSGNVLPDPTEEDIKKYNLDIKDYSQEMDVEEIDYGELDE